MSGSANLNAPLVTVDFDAVATGKQVKKKRLSPLSVRLSAEQRAQLEQDAMGMALSAYVLSKLFDSKKRKRLPTKQEKAVVSALRRLGHAGIATYLMSQIVALEEGRLRLSTNDEKQLRDAYTECHAVRSDLIAAMGLGTASGANADL